MTAAKSNAVKKLYGWSKLPPYAPLDEDIPPRKRGLLRRRDALASLLEKHARKIALPLFFGWFSLRDNPEFFMSVIPAKAGIHAREMFDGSPVQADVAA